jgi:hypothetical protein
MQFRLRTLLIVLGVLPPLLAVAWMVGRGEPVNPVLVAVVIYIVLLGMLLVANWVSESLPYSIATLVRSRSVREGYCSFCGQNHREAGPLAEGPHAVYICHRCVKACGQLIADELKRLGKPGS